jgi:hypothetical protein
LTSFTRPLLDVGFWPIATNCSLGPDVSFWGEAEVDRAAEFAASVENDPVPTSICRFFRDVQQPTFFRLLTKARRAISRRSK